MTTTEEAEALAHHVGTAAAMLRDLAAERDRLREALIDVERAYYTKGKTAVWLAAKMRGIAYDALKGDSHE